MEYLVHFVFELFKIAVLSSVYATAILLIVKAIGKNKPNGIFYKISRRKKLCWFLSGLIISIGLFVFMFSYWGDHGLGDSAKIPIGYEKYVEQINGTTAYISPDGYDNQILAIKGYTTIDNYLFAKIDSNPIGESYRGFAIWELSSNKLQITDSSGLEKFKISKGLKEKLNFSDFDNHYNDYWNGWRFWFLP